MSALRAKCPDCRTLTAVAIGPEYQCHSCGREFAAGLVRVPRAWGDGGEPMVEAASLALDYPEVAVVEEETLAMQTLAVASDLAKSKAGAQAKEAVEKNRDKIEQQLGGKLKGLLGR